MYACDLAALLQVYVPYVNAKLESLYNRAITATATEEPPHLPQVLLFVVLLCRKIVDRPMTCTDSVTPTDMSVCQWDSSCNRRTAQTSARPCT